MTKSQRNERGERERERTVKKWVDREKRRGRSK